MGGQNTKTYSIKELFICFDYDDFILKGAVIAVYTEKTFIIDNKSLWGIEIWSITSKNKLLLAILQMNASKG